MHPKPFKNGLILAQVCLLMALLMWPAVAPGQFSSSTNSDGSLTLTGYSGGATMSVPSAIGGRMVSGIGNFAFASNGVITSVSIPNSVTNIGFFAFAYCSNLLNVTFPNTFAGTYYANIGGYAFYLDSRLASFVLSNSVSIIGNDAFAECHNLKTFTVGGGHSTIIGDYAFLDCSALPAFTFPDNTLSIGSFTFNGCYSFTAITVPNTVAQIGTNAFGSCYNLGAINVQSGGTHFSSSAGVLFNFDQTELLQYPEAPAGPYTVPGTVTRIADYAFSSCNKLTSVTTPGSVTNIGDSAFSFCGALTNAALQNGLTGIGNQVFDDCLQLLNAPIPPTVTTIGTNAFYNCTHLRGVTLPGALTSIGDNAFTSCNLVTNFDIPAGVTSIGFEAFSSCISLGAINVDASNPDYSSLNGVLFNKNQTVLVSYPAGVGGGGNYAMPGTVTGIGPGAFAGCVSLASVIIPGTVTTIGSNAFAGATISNLAIPDSVTQIGDHAFESSRLAKITLSDKLTSIGNFAFASCSRLASIIIPASVTNIGDSAFYIDYIARYYFAGNAPVANPNAFTNTIFAYSVAYYLAGTTGWGANFDGLPTLLYVPPLFGSGVGVRSNAFGFTISGPTNQAVIVEATTNLATPDWQPVASLTPSGGSGYTPGSVYFSDTLAPDLLHRYYRLNPPPPPSFLPGPPVVLHVAAGETGYGLEFTALRNATLSSFTYTNVGLADKIELMDVASNSIVGSATVPAGNPNATVTAGWPLIAGRTYYLLGTYNGGVSSTADGLLGPANYPYSDADISVFSGIFTTGFGPSPQSSYWIGFNNLTTTPL